MLSSILILLSGLSPQTRRLIWTILIAAGAVILAIAYFTNQGYQDALSDVEEQNQEAITEADRAAATSDECHDLGGMWNQRTGQCERRVPSVPSTD